MNGRLAASNNIVFEHLFGYDEGVLESPLVIAHRHLTQAVDELCAAGESGASDNELLSVLTLCEGTSRRLDRLAVGTVAALQRRGTFTERGYKSVAGALDDLLGWERFESRRRVTAAEQVCPRVGLDDTPLPARLAATAEAFAAGQASLRHVEVIARVLGTAAADRLSPADWAAAEVQLVEKVTVYRPSELQAMGHRACRCPRRRRRPTRRPPARPGQRVAPHPPPRRQRRPAQGPIRRCGDVRRDRHRDRCEVHTPHRRRRPHRSPAPCRGPRRCVWVVLDGKGQPLDVGRITRTIPDGLRRAVAARDRGCAHPGCNRPPSWCEVHHIHAWEHGGATTLDNLVMACRAHHRLLHHSEWIVRISDGLPEFVPPAWIDPDRTPRRKPLPHLVRAA